MPANPIQIADAALYLSKTQPSLGITDPYELTEAQLERGGEAAQRTAPADQEVLGAAPSDEVELFKNGDVVIGAAWPLPDEQLLEAPRSRSRN